MRAGQKRNVGKLATNSARGMQRRFWMIHRQHDGSAFAGMDAMQQFRATDITEIHWFTQRMFACRLIHVDIDGDVAYSLRIQNFCQQLTHASEADNNDVSCQSVSLGIVQCRWRTTMRLLPCTAEHVTQARHRRCRKHRQSYQQQYKLR